MNSSLSLAKARVLAIALLVLFINAAFAGDSPASKKPVLLYSRYYNAVGEKRYLPEGNYKDILDHLRTEFDVRINSDPLTSETLAGVNVVLVANPSDKAAGTNPAPPHISAADVKAITRYVENGGGFIVMGNQENHNLETRDMNQLLLRFGMQFTNLYTDAKKLVLPSDTPLIGGLRWAYYTGDLVLITPNHPAKPRPLILNDLAQKPLGGPRDTPGALLAIAEPGRGHVVVVTDAGWLSNEALSEKGIGNVAIKGQDNWEILRRLTRWAAGDSK